MRVRYIDLDGNFAAEQGRCSMRDWGPHVRLACRFGRYRRFERALDERLGPRTEPELTFYGSGDFHHVSLALVRRAAVECNLLILDLHPDWMRAVPLMHCGTWVWHALRLPHVRRVFHVGGDMDFDNAYRWLAPWRELRSGRLTVWPAVRRFELGRWRGINHEPLKPPGARLSGDRLAELLAPHAAELARRPLYVSLDKDVMGPADAIVNWESGFLSLDEVCEVLTAFGAGLAGMDVTGDWSPVEVRGPMRRWLDWSEHPPLAVNAVEAAVTNARTNAAIVEMVVSEASAKRR
jgi:hypothetical protein